MKPLLSFVTFLLAIQYFQICSSTGLYKEYGDVCSPNDKCNPRYLLTCINGICTCPEPDKIIYDPTSNKCVARVGKNCGPIHSKTEGKSSVVLDCVEDAICDDGFCICGERYFGSIHGTCVRKKSFGEVCYHERECDLSFSRPTICQEGICQCDERYQIYDEERKVCVGLVGSECNDTSTSYANECAEHAECRDGVCICQNGKFHVYFTHKFPTFWGYPEKHEGANAKNYLIGYAETLNGTCENGYGQPCGANYPCSDIQLACINGLCECQLPLHQVYDKKLKECVSLVSGPCTMLNQTREDATEADRESKGVLRVEQKCVQNADCIDRGYYNECQCKPGFVQTKEGTCAPGYGESCEADECDPITPLYCRNGKCDCIDMFQVYDRSARKCVGLAGSRCSVDDPRCVEYASCVLQPNAQDTGKCLCDKYAHEVENRTCIYPI